MLSKIPIDVIRVILSYFDIELCLLVSNKRFRELFLDKYSIVTKKILPDIDISIYSYLRFKYEPHKELKNYIKENQLGLLFREYIKSQTVEAYETLVYSIARLDRITVRNGLYLDDIMNEIYIFAYKIDNYGILNKLIENNEKSKYRTVRGLKINWIIIYNSKKIFTASNHIISFEYLCQKYYNNIKKFIIHNMNDPDFIRGVFNKCNSEKILSKIIKEKDPKIKNLPGGCANFILNIIDIDIDNIKTKTKDNDNSSKNKEITLKIFKEKEKTEDFTELINDVVGNDHYKPTLVDYIVKTYGNRVKDEYLGSIFSSTDFISANYSTSYISFHKYIYEFVTKLEFKPNDKQKDNFFGFIAIFPKLIESMYIYDRANVYQFYEYLHQNSGKFESDRQYTICAKIEPFIDFASKNNDIVFNVPQYISNLGFPPSDYVVIYLFVMIKDFNDISFYNIEPNYMPKVDLLRRASADKLYILVTTKDVCFKIFRNIYIDKLNELLRMLFSDFVNNINVIGKLNDLSVNYLFIEDCEYLDIIIEKLEPDNLRKYFNQVMNKKYRKKILVEFRKRNDWSNIERMLLPQ